MPRKTKASPDGPDLLGDGSRIREQATSIIRHSFEWQRSVGRENHIRSIAIYPPAASRNGMWLIIGKAWSGGHKLVAFHRASDIITALVGFLSRASQGKLEWKPDTYADKDILP